jgi:toxin ParE1/3/4
MIVVISDEAEAELEAIGDWIAQANPTRTLSFVMELQAPVRGSLGCAERFPASSAL